MGARTHVHMHASVALGGLGFRFLLWPPGVGGALWCHTRHTGRLRSAGAAHSVGAQRGSSTRGHAAAEPALLQSSAPFCRSPCNTRQAPWGKVHIASAAPQRTRGSPTRQLQVGACRCTDPRATQCPPRHSLSIMLMMAPPGHRRPGDEAKRSGIHIRQDPVEPPQTNNIRRVQAATVCKHACTCASTESGTGTSSSCAAKCRLRARATCERVHLLLR